MGSELSRLSEEKSDDEYEFERFMETMSNSGETLTHNLTQMMDGILKSDTLGFSYGLQEAIEKRNLEAFDWLQQTEFDFNETLPNGKKPIDMCSDWPEGMQKILELCSKNTK